MSKIVLFILLVPFLLTAADLEEIFQNPPESAKPRGYWVWPQGNFDYSSIRHDLEEFKAKGFGGVDIWDLGIKDTKDVIPTGPQFMSPEQVDGIAFALQEAKRLDLKMGLIVSSSWNAGATWTTPEHASMNLVASADTVDGPITYKEELPFPDLPTMFSKPYGTFQLDIPKDQNGEPQYSLDVATIAYPLNKNGVIENSAKVRILKNSHIDIKLPAGRWVIMRTVCANFGQKLWVPSDNSNGLAIDHFSKEAVDDHFKTIINRLEKRIGPLQETALERLYLASYESNAEVIWTPTLVDEFVQRNGYRIEPFIPALFGTVVQDKNITERFLYDFRKTVSDLFVENLYRNARDICHNYNLKICCEAGGPGAPLHDVPTEDLKALGSLDVMRGEFWVDKKDRLNPDGLAQLQIVKSIASAAHTYGHKIVEMEAFTSHDNWRQSPATLKPFADRAFCEGMNRVVYHTMTQNLPEAGVPGWTFGAGTHMNANATWWDMSTQWHTYISRCSAMLQQGHFVADAAFYYGHDIPNFAKTKHVRPQLGRGYDYDDINTEVLLTTDVKDGRIVCPGGMSYSVLVLPDDNRMDLTVLKKIKALLENGATVIGPKPSRIYGLADYEKQEIELVQLASELWGQKSPKKLDKKIGKGRLVVGKTARDILQDINIGPDVELFNTPSDTTFDYIHRKTEDEDVYFIRNTTSTPLTVDARFRIQNKQPELWDAVTGDMASTAIFVQEKNGVRLPINLDAFGSVFVIFREPPAQTFIVRASFNDKQIFPTKAIHAIPVDARIEKNSINFLAEKPGRYEIELNHGNTHNIMNPAAEIILVDGPWEVRFPHGWEAQTQQTFDSLSSWTNSDDPGTRAFSGTATYKKSFFITKDLDTFQAILNLGDVKEICHVFLNGHDLGISSFVPHEFDVTGIIRSGENFLIVKVANTWLNRLIEDDKRPEEERLTHTNLTRGPTSTTAWREAQPKPSGLLGPVTIKLVH